MRSVVISDMRRIQNSARGDEKGPTESINEMSFCHVISPRSRETDESRSHVSFSQLSAATAISRRI